MKFICKQLKDKIRVHFQTFNYNNVRSNNCEEFPTGFAIRVQEQFQTSFRDYESPKELI